MRGPPDGKRPMRKPSVSRFSKMKLGKSMRLDQWHNGNDLEIGFYARSLQSAARILVGKLDREARTGWDVCPAVLLYRQALELHLKLLVGEGSNFLTSPTDPISLSTTHSLRWLAQIVCQIIRKVRWESDFKCEGVSCLTEFSAVVNEVESFDPVTRLIRSRRTGGPDSVAQYVQNFDIFGFAAKLDALLDLLNSTADALAAEWNVRETAMADTDFGSSDFEPTIQ